MKLLTHIYKTKTLSEYGIFIVLALIVILVSGNIFIPSYSAQEVDDQLLKIKGKHLKYNDSPHVKDFLLSVKNNDGYICMGTSESTPLRDGNYYEFLDQDTSYDTRFSILGGAGWTCGLHMPMLLNYAQEVDSLNLIYFINPVYWRSELNSFKKSYWLRYLNYGTYKKTIAGTDEQEFIDISDRYRKELHLGEKLIYRSVHWLRKMRSPFFQDLSYLLSPDNYSDDLEYFAEQKTGDQSFNYFGKIDTSYIDTVWNITHEFKARTWLNPISDDDYRYRELIAFNNLCNELGVNVTYILGPVNEIYIRKYHPPYMDAYLQTLEKIEELLIEEEADYIDASDLGNIPGSFIDNQHHSSYGAYLIYQKIKNHIDEKEDR